MKLKDVRETYYSSTGKVSDIVRQLAFAGLAVVWIFKGDIGGRPTVPPALILAALLLVVGLALDLFHYITAGAIWGVYNRVKEKEGKSEDDEFLAPSSLNWPILLFFWSKTVAVVIAYCVILRFLGFLLR